MRIVVIGPTHPLKGGVAQHTTVMAARLASAGHDVALLSWSNQYPSRLYPGQQTVLEAEFDPFEPTERALSWSRPDTWLRARRRLRQSDVAVIAHLTPAQAPAYWSMLAGPSERPARKVLVAHNVLPHERRFFDRPLVRHLFSAADAVVAHSPSEAALARQLSPTPVTEAEMPPHFPKAFGPGRPAPGEHRRLLFFGLVRPYKGLDLLIRALALGPADVTLRVAGEFWGGSDEFAGLARDLGVEDRVEIHDGYVAASDVPALFSDVDAMVLPYRSATGSQAVWMAHQFGVPVIATDVGGLAANIRDGVDGLVVARPDATLLGEGLNRFYAGGTGLVLREAVAPVDPDPYWDRYLDAIMGVDGRDKEDGCLIGRRPADP